MPHSLRLQFSLRTLLLAMLILGASPWIYLKWREYREDRIWNSLATAKVTRERALITWRTAYEAYARDKSEVSANAEVQAQKGYYAARQKVADAVNQLHSLYDNVPGGLEQAIAMRHGRKAMAQRTTNSAGQRDR